MIEHKYLQSLKGLINIYNLTLFPRKDNYIFFHQIIVYSNAQLKTNVSNSPCVFKLQTGRRRVERKYYSGNQFLENPFRIPRGTIVNMNRKLNKNIMIRMQINYLTFKTLKAHKYKKISLYPKLKKKKNILIDYLHMV